jgi:hypothetical protein
MALKFGIKKASEAFDIGSKNIKRWIDRGI